MLGGAAGAAIGSKLIDKPGDQTKSGKREMLPPGEMPPNKLGGDSELPKDMKNTTAINPGIDPVDLKDLTESPGFTPSDFENVIEIFPNHSDKRPSLINERRGNEVPE